MEKLYQKIRNEKDKLRTLSNITDAAHLQKQLTVVTIFPKHSIIDVWQET